MALNGERISSEHLMPDGRVLGIVTRVVAGGMPERSGKITMAYKQLYVIDALTGVTRVIWREHDEREPLEVAREEFSAQPPPAGI